MTLSRKLTVKYIVSAIVLLSLTIGVPIVVFMHIKHQVRNDILNSMRTVNEATEHSLELWINEEKSTVKNLAVKNNILLSYVETLLQSQQTNADLAKHLTTEKIRHYFSPLIENKGYMGIYVISLENIIIAAMHDEKLGYLSFLPNSDAVLKKVVKGETIMSMPQFSNAPRHNAGEKFNASLPAMFITTPIYNEQKEIIAFLSFQMDPALNFSRLLQLGRIGKSGETYALNQAATLISESRFDDQLKEIGLIGAKQTAVLNIAIRNPGYNLLKHRKNEKLIVPIKMPLTLMAESATSGISSHNLDGYRDYRGVPVIGIWKWNDDLGFGIATEIDVNDAFHTLDIIKSTIIIASIFNILLISSLIIMFMQYNRTIRRQSLEDGLTGIANRRMLDIKLELEFSNALRDHQPLTICMIDIDHFKLFNDRLGHLAGDDALKLVSQLIKSVVKRKIDLVARYGGEEFCVVLPNTPIEDALHIAEKIRLHVSRGEMSRHQPDESPWLTISLGVAQGIESSDTCVDDIIARADKALYMAKRDGRDCVRQQGT